MTRHTTFATAISVCLGGGLCATEAAAATKGPPVKGQPAKSCVLDKASLEVMECQRYDKANAALDQADKPLGKQQLDATITACGKVALGDHSICSKADAVETIGNAHFIAGQWDRAIELFTKVIAMRPNSESGYVDRGKTYFKLHKFDEAVADLRQGALIDESIGHGRGSYIVLAAVYGKLKEYDLAIDAYTQAIARIPEEETNRQYLSVLYHDRGEAWSSKGDAAKAEADYARAKEFSAKQQ